MVTLEKKKKTLTVNSLHQQVFDEMASDEFRLTSSGIAHEGRLARKYTQEGQGAQKDISPPLEWYNVPPATKTLALVVEDIDAEEGVPWTHWVVVNIPPTLKGLPEGFSGKEEAGDEYGETKEGHNDWKVPGWRGSMLPNHGHRILFKVYALDETMNLGNKVTKDKLLDSIEDHVVGEAELMAIY